MQPLGIEDAWVVDLVVVHGDDHCSFHEWFKTEQGVGLRLDLGEANCSVSGGVEGHPLRRCAAGAGQVCDVGERVRR
jgi:hypothetical protein